MGREIQENCLKIKRKEYENNSRKRGDEDSMAVGSQRRYIAFGPDRRHESYLS